MTPVNDPDPVELAARIAACARAAGATLVTTERDFEHLDGSLLDVEWIDPVAGWRGL